ncbi:flagellar biosynthesis anti-sigma factor FlgM [Halomonas sediminis]
MKIDNIHSLLRTNQAPQREETQKAGPAKAPEAAAHSSSTTQLSQSNVSDSQDIDVARVEEIRAAIREGRMEINADRIADGLIANLKETLGDDQQ